MKSVLFLHGSNDLYGASRVLLGDVEVLVALGASVRVVLPDSGPLSPLLTQAGAEVLVRPLRVLRRVKPISMLQWPSRLPVATDPDELVVVWTLALLPYVPALVARRIETVLSVHEILPGPAGSGLAKLASMSAAPIMVNSAATASWLAAHGCDRKRVRLMYPAAPAYELLPQPVPDSPFRVLLAGRVGGWKGHVEAVDAVQKLRDGGVEAELTLAGAPFPGQENHLARLLERLVGLPWARYIGQVPNIRDVLMDHHVLLVASVAPEPFGLVAVEAWAAGRRVVAPDEGGVAEAARMVDGVAYRPRDVDAMAAALELVAKEPALRRPPSSDAPVVELCTVANRTKVWSDTLRRTGT